jgi:DNA-binding transcriptional MerR regulator
MADRKKPVVTSAMLKNTMKLVPFSSADMCDLFDCKRQTVQEYVSSGVLHPEMKGRSYQFNVWESVQAVTRKLREAAAGRTKEARIIDLEEEKLKADVEIKKARSRRADIELKELESKLLRADDVEAITTDMVITMRNALLTLPGRLALDCAKAKTAAQASARIEKEVHLLLAEFAEYMKFDPAEYRRRLRERIGVGDAEDD